VILFAPKGPRERSESRSHHENPYSRIDRVEGAATPTGPVSSRSGMILPIAVAVMLVWG